MLFVPSCLFAHVLEFGSSTRTALECDIINENAFFVLVTGKSTEPEETKMKDTNSEGSTPEPEEKPELPLESEEIVKVDENVDENENKSKSIFQLPSSYRHQLCTLRQNLVEAFIG